MWSRSTDKQSRKNCDTLWLVAGGSGGHILPAIELAKQWAQHHPNRRIVLYTLKRKLDRLIAENNVVVDSIVTLSLPPLPRGRLFFMPAFLIRFSIVFLRVLLHGLFRRPTRVITTGGLVAVPVCLAARVLRSPIEVVELNAEFGSATSLLIRFASRIRVVFLEALQELCTRRSGLAARTRLIDYPLRTPDAPPLSRAESLVDVFAGGASNEKATVFVLGGSQGSRFLSRAVLSWLETLAVEHREKLQVIHQVGDYDQETVRERYAERGVSAVVFSYRPNLASCYQAADCVVTRAGAGTLHELAAVSKRSIVIPLETAATAHQVANATAMVKRHRDLFTLVRQQDVLSDPTAFHAMLNHVVESVTGSQEATATAQPSQPELQAQEPSRY